MLGKEIDAFLVIPDDVFANDRFEIYAKNISNFTFNRQMEDFVSRTVIQQRMQENGLDSQLIKKLNRSVKANTFKLEKEGAKKQSSSAAFSVGYALGIYLIFALTLYGSFVMRGIIEDKNSRVIEIVVSSHLHAFNFIYCYMAFILLDFQSIYLSVPLGRIN